MSGDDRQTDEATGGVSPEVVRPEVVRPDGSARLWAGFCHVGALIGMLVPVVGQALGPLLIWLASRHRSPFVDDQGRQAINFGATISIIDTALWASGAAEILVLVTLIEITTLTIAAAVAWSGVRFRYYLCLPLLRAPKPRVE